MHPRELVSRLLGTLRSGDREREAAQEELAFHLAMLEESHRRRGLSAAQAHRAALLDLGSPASTIEQWHDQRGLPWLDSLVQDVRFALRTLGRARGFTIAALLTLGIGIGANAAIFSVVDAVLLRPLPYARPEQLVMVGDTDANGTPGTTGFITLQEWKERSRGIRDLAIIRDWMPTLVAAGEAERIPSLRVSWNYFATLGVRPALGRDFTRADDDPQHWRVVMLGDALWRRRFGADPGVVGRLLRMNDKDYRIVGVLPASYEPLLSARFYTAAEMWAPLGYDATIPYACRSCQHLRAIARLAPGVTPAQATAELAAIRGQQRHDHPQDYGPESAGVETMQRAIAGPVAAPLRILFLAVAFVLLVACANVANLLLARSLDRRRELAVRATLGAGRRRIVRQLVTESAVLGLGGALLGLVVAAVLVRALTALAPQSLPRASHIGIDARVFAFAVLLGLATGVLFGLAPALRAATLGLRATLASDGRGSTGGQRRARAALVVVDLVVALVLLAGAGVMLRTVERLLATSPGFDPRGVLTVQLSLGGARYAETDAVLSFERQLLERVRAIPGVRDAAIASQVPLGGNGDRYGFHVRGLMRPNPADDPSAERYEVTPGYFRLLHIPLRAGRLFDERDTAEAPQVMLVSAATARLLWGGASPLGAQVRVGGAEKGRWVTVIGVVGDVHHADLTGSPSPAMYLAQTQYSDGNTVLLVKAAGLAPARLLPTIEAAVHEIDGSVPLFAAAPMEELVRRSVAERRFVSRLLGGFAATALLLAAIGLYGVVAYGVAQRRREVGIRVALGAQRRDVLAALAREGAVMVVVGLGVGLLAALLATHSLGGLVYGVSATDPPSFGGACALLVLVAVAAHWIPLRRALRAGPLLAMRID